MSVASTKILNSSKKNSKKELKRFYKNKPKNFVYIGAIGPAKGLHLVLENWPKIRRKFKNCQLRIIGGNLYQQDNIVKNSFFIFSNSFITPLETLIKLAEDSFSMPKLIISSPFPLNNSLGSSGAISMLATSLSIT